MKATVGGVSGQARVRVIPPLPWTFDFEGRQGAPMPGGRRTARASIGTVDGSGVLVRPRDDTVGRRASCIMGRPDWSDYTVEADVRGIEMRRQRGDVGLINQRYVLVLFGNGQKLELHPWQAADEMTVRVPFAWDVEHLVPHEAARREPAGRHHARAGQGLAGGDQPEPAAWTIEKIDKIPHRNGRAGPLRATASRTCCSTTSGSTRISKRADRTSSERE